MSIQHDRVTVTTAADGSATAYSAQFTGYLAAIRYEKSDYADTVDFTITTESSAQGLWTETDRTASESVYPTVPLDDNDGTTVTDPARGRILIMNERVKIVLAAGGATKTGYFHIFVEN